jgi:hypothetical protein
MGSLSKSAGFSVAIGFAIGFLCGWLSTINLSQVDALFRPPLIFSGGMLLFAIGLLRPNFGQLMALGVISMAIYWIGVLLGPLFSSSFTLAAGLLSFSIVKILRLGKFNWLAVAVIFIFVASILVDSNYRMLLTVVEGGFSTPTPTEKLGKLDCLAIAFWQTIMMTAIALQFHTERLHRQRLAVQVNADGGLYEP